MSLMSQFFAKEKYSSLKLMTHLSRFFLVNQEYTEWPVKSESQANDSFCFTESEIYSMTSEVWVNDSYKPLSWNMNMNFIATYQGL